MKEVVLDTETTGLSVKEGHRIVEIGCIELDNLIPTSNKFHCYLNPERKVSEKAFEVHGYTNEFLSTKQKFKEIADDFLSFINNKIFDLNIKNVENDEEKILNAMEQIDGKKVKSSFDFGDGQSSKRFFDIISKTEIWDINLQKYFIEMDEKN